jgi:hypothetical protein
MALVLGLVTTAAADDIVWRAHCDFPGKGPRPTESVHDTSRECNDTLARAVLLDDDNCKAGNQTACGDQKRTLNCRCKPEKVQ